MSENKWSNWSYVETERPQGVFFFCVCVEEREHVEGVVITYKAKTSKSIGLCGGSESLAILVDENFLIWNFKKGCSYAFVSEMLLISRFACNMNDVC